MKLLERLNVSDERLEAFCREHAIVELSIFGSAARDSLRPDSDVDVMVTFATDATWDLYDYVAMKDELASLFGRPVDLVESGTVRNPFRRRSIERDLTVVYAA